MKALEVRKFLTDLNDVDFRYLNIQLSMARDARNLIQEFNLSKEKLDGINEDSSVESVRLSALALLKEKLVDLRSKDILSRKFSVISSPSVPSEPFSPKRAVILGATAFGSLFIGILAVFVRSAVRRAKAQRRSVAA